jgi:hypothetical protein
MGMQHVAEQPRPKCMTCASTTPWQPAALAGTLSARDLRFFLPLPAAAAAPARCSAVSPAPPLRAAPAAAGAPEHGAPGAAPAPARAAAWPRSPPQPPARMGPRWSSHSSCARGLTVWCVPGRRGAGAPGDAVPGWRERGGARQGPDMRRPPGPRHEALMSGRSASGGAGRAAPAARGRGAPGPGRALSSRSASGAASSPGASITRTSLPTCAQSGRLRAVHRADLAASPAGCVQCCTHGTALTSPCWHTWSQPLTRVSACPPCGWARGSRPAAAR